MLDRAVIEFWRHGYAGLGLDDLLTQIGLSRASMYRTFGSKADFDATRWARFTVSAIRSPCARA
ncbi:MAG: helix-turn-helix domain-containing protein [Ornithinimicrobium sp.]